MVKNTLKEDDIKSLENVKKPFLTFDDCDLICEELKNSKNLNLIENMHFTYNIVSKIFLSFLRKEEIISYYHKQFPDSDFPEKKGKAKVLCCFHQEKTPSLILNLDNGSFHCLSCGNRGTDHREFHFKRYGKYE